jgi:3-oxoacyl-[acyl-carrier-protein] synthase-3
MGEVVRSIFLGCGSYLPERILSNDEISTFLDTSDEWIYQRTGIHQRHIAGNGETTASMAIASARQALSAANITADDLDVIIVASTTPDKTLPATAVYVQKALQANSAFAFDIQAVCAGFIYAITIADSFISSNRAKVVLVIGSETMSRVLDWKDRSTSILFGDGSGAVVLKASSGNGTLQDRGILVTKLCSDGNLSEILCSDGGVSTTQSSGFLRMKGPEVFRHAVKNLTDVAKKIMDDLDISAEDIDLVIPHQANARIIKNFLENLGIPFEKSIITLSEQANTSAASIPLAIYNALQKNRLKKGNLVLIVALGSGMAWGGAILRW